MELRDNILVSGNADSTVKIWDILTGQCLQTLSGRIIMWPDVTVHCSFIYGPWSKDYNHLSTQAPISISRLWRAFSSTPSSLSQAATMAPSSSGTWKLVRNITTCLFLNNEYLREKNLHWLCVFLNNKYLRKKIYIDFICRRLHPWPSGTWVWRLRRCRLEDSLVTNQAGEDPTIVIIHYAKLETYFYWSYIFQVLNKGLCQSFHVFVWLCLLQVCAVGSRNGTEETKLMVLDFDAEAKWSRFMQNKANQTHLSHWKEYWNLSKKYS